MISSNSSQSFSPPPDLRAQALPSFSTVASLRTCRNPRKPFLFTHLLHNLRTPQGWGYICSTLSTRNRSLVSPQRSGWAAKPFKIRTSEKHACKPRRIRTSKTLDLKLFRMNTYKKRGRGEGYGSAVTSFVLRSYPFEGESSKPFSQASAIGWRRWTSREIAATLLVIRRVSPRAIPPATSRPGGLTVRSQSLPSLSPITKRKRAKHVQETHGRSCDCGAGLFSRHFPSRARSKPSG
jgi:hypothetical protein